MNSASTLNNYGLIFDLDGVITDTAEYHFLAWKQLANDEGLPFSRQDNEQLRGVSRRESLRRLLKEKPISEEIALEWMERKNAYYQQYLEKVSPADLLPGAHEFLVGARQVGFKIGLASASRNASTVVDRLEIRDLFDVLGDGNAVVNTKPAVDLFVWVAGGFGLPVDQCVVFEDAEAGIEGALHAGMKCVGIGPVQRVGQAHVILDGLQHAVLDQILDLIRH